MTAGDGESSGTGLMTMISGLGEGEQTVKKSLLKQLGDADGVDWQPGLNKTGVHDGECVGLEAAGDDALAPSGAGGVAKKRSAVRGGIANAAAVLSRRRPGRLTSLVAMWGGRKYTGR